MNDKKNSFSADDNDFIRHSDKGANKPVINWEECLNKSDKNNSTQVQKRGDKS